MSPVTSSAAGAAAVNEIESPPSDLVVLSGSPRQRAPEPASGTKVTLTDAPTPNQVPLASEAVPPFAVTSMRTSRQRSAAFQR